MLRAIREHWRIRIPFYGINTGHLGFLLNDSREIDFLEQELVLYPMPLLWVEVESLEGEVRRRWRSTTRGSSGPPARRPGSA